MYANEIQVLTAARYYAVQNVLFTDRFSINCIVVFRASLDIG